MFCFVFNQNLNVKNIFWIKSLKRNFTKSRPLGVYLFHTDGRAHITDLLTYLLTPWCRVLLEKLTGLQLVKKSPAFHGTRRFITALTSVRHLSLSWTSPIQSIYTHPTSWRSVLILSTHLLLGLPSGLLPSGFPSKTLYTPSPHPYAPHADIRTGMSNLVVDLCKSFAIALKNPAYCDTVCEYLYFTSSDNKETLFHFIS